MKGDFSRSSFNSAKHYRGVRLQQGRIQLDADWNEQIDILLHHNERELKDLIGPYGAPQGNAGFAITLPPASANPDATGTMPPAALLPPDVQIAKGQRYVDGILCINEADCTFTTQPDFPGATIHRQAMAGHQQQLVYLDVWQHHITAREDGDLREVALGGLDTTTRIQTVAQVKFWPLPADLAQAGVAPTLATAFQALLAVKQKPKGKLTAQKTEKGAILQNQLYRIEIHSVKGDQVAFKWSRENGAIAYSVREIKVNPENTAQLDIQLKDVKSDQIDLRINNWVEISCNDDALDGKAGVFGKVIDIQPDLQLVTVQPGDPLSALDPAICDQKRMLLQRWDQSDGTTGVVARPVDTWLTLENELQVKFSKDGEYTVGDYWLIPARANLKQGAGDILWPPGEAKPPVGTEHHYAPLACLQYAAGQWQIVDSETITFGTLPIITKKVDEVVDRVTQVEAEIVDLKARVTRLEEQMAEVLTLIKREQTSLYQNFKSSVALEKGLVVAIDPSADFHVVPANLSNETLVLGIVDEVIPGDFPYRVIFQGRAQCKVVGPVKVGDLLTPTELDGHAGRGGLYLRPGTIIGKALRTYLPDDPEDVGLLDVMIIIS